MLLSAIQAILIAGWVALSTQSTANNRTIVAATVQNSTTGLVETAGQLGNQNVPLQINTDLGVTFANAAVFDPDTAATFVPEGPELNVTLPNLRAAAKVRQAKVNPPEKASRAVNAIVRVQPGYIRTKVGVALKGGFALGDGTVAGVAMAAVKSVEGVPGIVASDVSRLVVSLLRSLSNHKHRPVSRLLAAPQSLSMIFRR